jgi:dimethylglycine dehydrogenase
LIDRAHAGEGTELAVHVVGVERKARIIADSPHDPAGARMRG